VKEEEEKRERRRRTEKKERRKEMKTEVHLEEKMKRGDGPCLD